MELKLEVLTDSTANLGMHNGTGSGRARHLDVKWLWTQEAVQAGRFSLKKGWHIQQRGRCDDETSRWRETEGLDDFGETAIHQRTR